MGLSARHHKAGSSSGTARTVAIGQHKLRCCYIDRGVIRGLHFVSFFWLNKLKTAAGLTFVHDSGVALNAYHVAVYYAGLRSTGVGIPTLRRTATSPCRGASQGPSRASGRGFAGAECCGRWAGGESGGAIGRCVWRGGSPGRQRAEWSVEPQPLRFLKQVISGFLALRDRLAKLQLTCADSSVTCAHGISTV